jgi:hypothetical protein
MQLSFIPGLARHGALRAQAEAVRVAASHRSRGLGEAMFQWAIDEARCRGCALVQLTTDKTRADAHRFYDVLVSRRHTRVTNCSSECSADFNAGATVQAHVARTISRVLEAGPHSNGRSPLMDRRILAVIATGGRRSARLAS